MRLFVLAALFVAAGLALSLPAQPKPAHACSCAWTTTAEKLARADAVFEGTVVAIHPYDPPRAPGSAPGWADNVLVEFKVHTVWKGPLDETAFVKTASQESACGIPYIDALLRWIPQEPSSAPRYVVLERDGWSGLCGGTKLTEDAQELYAELGEGWEPNPGQVAPSPKPQLTSTRMPITPTPAAPSFPTSPFNVTLAPIATPTPTTPATSTATPSPTASPVPAPTTSPAGELTPATRQSPATGGGACGPAAGSRHRTADVAGLALLAGVAGLAVRPKHRL